ncbi:MAG: MFS transporter [Chloroflexota bacterium]
MSLTLLAVGLVPSYAFWLACVVMLISGLMNSFVNGSFNAFFQSLIAPEMQGRVFSLMGSMMQVLALTGFLLIGPLTEWIGIQTVFVGAGVCAVLISSSMLLMPPIHQIEDQKAEDEPVLSDAALVTP